jgi:ribosomal protein L24E
VSRSFSVTKLAQTIAFPALANSTLAHVSITASAAASSHLAVTFTTNTPTVCRAGGTNGSKIAFVAGGTCVVRAAQPGNATFAAAPRVTRQFTIGSPVVTTSEPGYWMLGADGRVYAFGSATNFGSASDPAVAFTARHDGAGYWIVDSVGTVHAFGSAAYFGGHPSLLAGESVSTISSTPSDKGYWLFTTLGRAFAFGDAHFFGDMRAVHLNGPVIASVATPTGQGYYMVASDGGVFSFGDAHFHGSMGAAHLNRPIVGLSPTPDNRGYWLVASDGGVFAFGAPFRGSLGSVALNKPVNGLVAFGNGYLMVASDGGVFDFSNKHFVGSLGANPPSAPIVGIAGDGSA